MKLYEISEKYNQFISYLEDSEDLEELKDTLDSIEDAFDAKVESIVKLIKAKDAEQKAIEEEIKRLKTRADRLVREIEWLQNYIQAAMEHTGKEKVKSSLFNISLVLNPPAVNVVNESEVPDWAYVEKVTRSLDKRGLLERMKNGEQIPGVELIQRRRLKIS